MSQGCICYLVRHTPKDVQDLVEGLKQLQKNYLNKFPCPVHVFHEAELTSDMQAQILGAGVDLALHLIVFKAPLHVDKLAPRALGYRHMCRFFSDAIFWQPAVRQTRYYMRLDTDSRTPYPINYDLFEHMAKHDYKYGYIATLVDKPQYYQGLWSLVSRYLETKEPTLVPINSIQEGKCYYTNFEICESAWFRAEAWVSYFECIDNDGGIYRHRWGDHTIRYLGVNLFMPAKHIHQFTDVPYVHHKAYNMSHGTPKRG